MQYTVSVPITMHIAITVEANTEAEAKSSVFQADFGLDVIGKDKSSVEIVEWEMHNQICMGNVFSGVLNEIEVSAG